MNLHERDQKFVWHPFTQHRNAPQPLEIKSAKGAWLETEDGQRILDAVSSWWVTLHGHCHPHIIENMEKQLRELEHVIFAGCTHEKAVQLSERLIKPMPEGFGKVFYSDNGSTAVEVGIKMAVQYHHNLGQARRRVLAFRHAYHGDTFGSMAVSDRGPFTEAFHPMLFDVDFVDPPLRTQKRGESLAQLKFLLAQNLDEYAAFVYEPLVQGAGGMLMHDHTELDEMLMTAKTAGVLLVADEVMTGFGRTGKTFASEYLVSSPDVVCLSKGITGGVMALGATVARNSVFEAFLSDGHERTFFHGHSYSGNPLACAAGLASLDIFESEESQQDRQRIEASLHGFAQRLSEHPQAGQRIGDIRQQGCILAVEWKVDEASGYFANMRDKIYQHFVDRGILLRPLGNVSYILPPYCITNRELDSIYEAIEDFMTQGKG